MSNCDDGAMDASGFLTGRPHAAACSRDLPNFASFDSFLL